MKKVVHGVSLVELMVAMTLGLILIHGVIQFYQGMRHHLQHQIALSRVQENLRAASAMLREIIHADGYLGCVHFRQLPSPLKKSFEIYPEVKEAEGDLIYLQRMLQPYPLKQKPQKDGKVLYVQGKFPIKENQHIVLSDCHGAEPLIVLETHWLEKQYLTKLILKEKIKRIYSASAEVGEFESSVLFTRATGRYDEGGQPIYALNVKTLHEPSMPLVDGISSLTKEVLMNKWHQPIGLHLSLKIHSDIAGGLTRPWDAYFAYR